MHTACEVTILFIDINAFTFNLPNATAARLCEWVVSFCERVDAAAAAHGVIKAEVCGDCCICAAGSDGAVPLRGPPAAGADRRCDQATRMLACEFAAALHADLAGLQSRLGGAPGGLRKGAATAEAAFLLSEDGWEAGAGFASVQGDTVNMAAWIAGLAAPGTGRRRTAGRRRRADRGRRLRAPSVRGKGCSAPRSSTKPQRSSAPPRHWRRRRRRRIRPCSG